MVLRCNKRKHDTVEKAQYQLGSLRASGKMDPNTGYVYRCRRPACLARDGDIFHVTSLPLGKARGNNLITDKGLIRPKPTVALTKQLLSPKILDPEQVACIKDLIAIPRLLVDADCGVGKTIMLLSALYALFRDGKIKHVLLVAPNMVSQTVWDAEIKSWMHTQHLTYRILSGRTKHAIVVEGGKSPPQITIIGTHLFTHYANHFLNTSPALIYWPYDVIAVDEVSQLKNPTSQTTKAMRLASQKTPRFVGLTATPVPESLLDAWPQVTFVDDGYRLGKNITSFRNAHCEYSFVKKKHFLKAGHDRIIMRAMAQVTHRIEAAPRKYRIRTIRREVNLPEKFMESYRKLESNFIVEINKDEFDAVNSAALTGKLLQFATGAAYAEDGAMNRVNRVLHNTKLDMFDEIRSETNEPIILMYWFVADKKRLKERYGRDIEFISDHNSSPEALTALTDRWSAKQIPILAANPRNAAHGLNLQYGGRITVWMTPVHSGDLRKQGNHRTDRRGQTRDCLVYDLCAKGTLDGDVFDVSDGKIDAQQSTLDYLTAQMKLRASQA